MKRTIAVEPDCIAVIDIGKTHTRLSVIDSKSGERLRTLQRTNVSIASPLGRQLDLAATEAWLLDGLRSLPDTQRIAALVPVAHGAAAVLLDSNGAVIAAPDYEDPAFSVIDADYARERDAFSMTASPGLPLGLNLARQWFYLEQRHPEAFATVAHILLLPQYWAWRLSGVMASEVTSLGCHSDLWRPRERDYSALATAHGWTRLLPPIRRADETLGTITPEIARITDLPQSCRVACGIHDSNASYLDHLVDRQHGAPFTVISSGTWTVAMTSSGDLRRLRPERDMLANVDAFGSPVCTARFMGGREYDVIAGGNGTPQIEALESILQRHAFAAPAFARGGPFAAMEGRLHYAGELSKTERTALATLYCALMSDLLLDYLGVAGDVIIDGPLAINPLYGQVLAALRPSNSLCVNLPGCNATRAACYLAGMPLPPRQPATRAAPSPIAGLDQYRSAWRELLPSDSGIR